MGNVWQGRDYDGLFIKDGYEEAFTAVDKSGNGSIGRWGPGGRQQGGSVHGWRARGGGGEAFWMAAGVNISSSMWAVW
jgi:hypothetical protein